MNNLQKSFILILLLFTTIDSFSQKLFLIENVGTISIPQELELQGGKYKQSIDEHASELSIDYNNDSKMIFQQNGLNDMIKSSFSTYVRIIILTIKDEANAFPHLSNEFSQRDINDVNIIFKQQTSNSFQGTNLKLLRWGGTEKVKINNQNALKFTFIRQLNNHPLVKVQTFLFYNNDRLHEIICSYRLNEENYWSPIITKAVNTFKINNIR